MKLSDAQTRAFRMWLSSRGGVLLDCPVCRRRDWQPAEMIESGKDYRELVIYCGLCGYTYHFSMNVVASAIPN
ncbi:MAG: hypothetical protein GXY52_08125 [Chloroflexi bacterium]|nr:hypothetical protein [Chloroflexota bacterium]